MNSGPGLTSKIIYRWSRRLEEEGVNVLYGIEGYKVHSKICLVMRLEKKSQLITPVYQRATLTRKPPACMPTIRLLTANKKITADLVNIFKALGRGVLPKG